MNWEYAPLLIVLMFAVLGNNPSVSIAVTALLLLKLVGGDALFPYIEAHGLHIGITMITMGVLVPIATGRIGMKDIVALVGSVEGVVAMLVGIFVAYAAAQGLPLMQDTPQIVTALIVGTIIGVCFFHGLAVGPLIAAGLVAVLFQLGKLFS
ncbi:MAG: DUF441 domain-containing protein [Selenomonadales bacterium]|nr:DUF441 domain-containing protein [Selenomonadales bacterium]MBQ6712923.1 DUF441 domain-containing protein [Selenomonadales bacterium]